MEKKIDALRRRLEGCMDAMVEIWNEVPETAMPIAWEAKQCLEKAHHHLFMVRQAISP